MKYFRDLDLNILKDKKVILDIDGTITYDKSEKIESTEKNRLLELKKYAKEIILVSNGEENRSKNIAEIHGIIAHISKYQKPNKKVLNDILNKNSEEFVVVGDKFLTDGLLAIQHNIPFLHVKSLQIENESLKNKIIYFLDDIFGITFEFLRMLRPKQWIKNFLVFAPALFAGVIYVPNILLASSVAFIVFSLSASCVYILNDISDVENDRQHNKKKWRPIASYNISKNLAYTFSFLLLVLISILIYFYTSLFSIIFIYLILNIFYTLKLKQIPIFDVVTVATLYVMRVVAGGFATGIFISPWIISCTFFAALFLISSKRYVEFQNPIREVLKKYSLISLQALLMVSTTLSIMCYVLYTILGSHIKGVLYTSPFIVATFLIVLNDVFSLDKKMESPEVYLLTNRHVRFLIASWIMVFVFLIYFQ